MRSSIQVQKRPAPHDISPRPASSRRIQVPKASSSPLERVASLFVKRVIAGASKIMEGKDRGKQIAQIPTSSLDLYAAMKLFEGRAQGQKRMATFWWTMASFVSLMFRHKRNQPIEDKSERWRRRKWAKVVIAVLNGLEKRCGQRTLLVLSCLCCKLTSQLQMSKLSEDV